MVVLAVVGGMDSVKGTIAIVLEKDLISTEKKRQPHMGHKCS